MELTELSQIHQDRLEKAELLTAATVIWNHTLQLFVCKSVQPLVRFGQFIISAAV